MKIISNFKILYNKFSLCKVVLVSLEISIWFKVSLKHITDLQTVLPKCWNFRCIPPCKFYFSSPSFFSFHLTFCLFFFVCLLLLTRQSLMLKSLASNLLRIFCVFCLFVRFSRISWNIYLVEQLHTVEQ